MTSLEARLEDLRLDTADLRYGDDVRRYRFTDMRGTRPLRRAAPRRL